MKLIELNVRKFYNFHTFEIQIEITSMQKDCSVIILAAGYSSRMGCAKFALRLADGTSFLENIMNQYSVFGCNQIIVVVNSEGKEFLDQSPIRFIDELDFVVNQHPEYERFYSFKLGIGRVKNNQPVFLHNADNPFANYETLNDLYLNRGKADFVKPVFNKRGGHPILISHKILRDIILVKNHDINLNEFLKKYSCKEIETTDENILLNINRMSDYENIYPVKKI